MKGDKIYEKDSNKRVDKKLKFSECYKYQALIDEVVDVKKLSIIF